jgi:flagellar protein FlbD
MITLTRLRQNTPFILNPDLIERVDTHVDTVVRLTSGTEYVVNETGDEIVRRTIEFRARVLALAGAIDAVTPVPGDMLPRPTPEAATGQPEGAPETVWAPADEPVASDGDRRAAVDSTEVAP